MDAKSGFNMQTWVVDYDYIRTLGLQVKMGRNFSPEFGTDSNATIINETTATLLGYENPLGKKIYSQIGGPNGNKEFTIIGVVKNFNFETLHQAISPLALFLGNSNGLCAFKIQSTQIPMLIKNIGTKWKSLTSDLPFSYRFLDDSFNEMYQSDQRVGEIALLFSFLAILIACLGLFGLATFITEQRVKEIGIRKILGASVRKIVQLLSKEFIQLVVLSFLIAVPISWYFMHKWLNDYAYRVEINWRVYLLSGFIALFIAIITVGYHAIKAALINPIRNLRVE